jgi:hypothetical protein
MRTKIALKREIDRLIDELIQKNQNGIWLDDRESKSYQYNNLLTTIYCSRAILEFYSFDLSGFNEAVKASWDLKETIEYLSSDLSFYASEWKMANSSISIDEIDVLLHLEALVAHSLAATAPYLIRAKKDDLLRIVSDKCMQHLSHFSEVQKTEGFINNSERLFFTSRKLITAYYVTKYLGKEYIFKSGLNIKSALNFVLSKIDRSTFLVISKDPNFNTHMEESSIALESISLWVGENIIEDSEVTNRLAESIIRNTPDVYSGSIHDLNHIIKALFEHFGHEAAFNKPQFNRIFKKLYEAVRTTQYLNESRTNHPYSEIYYTLATLAKSHEDIYTSPSCFISYSTKDQQFASLLHNDLQRNGIECWFAPHDAKGGRKLHEQIEEAISEYDCLLLVLSANSMDSEWVKSEIAIARNKELIEGRQVLFPISLVDYSSIRCWKCFDADIGKDSAKEIREYFILDFTDWENPTSYKKAVDKLVEDLRAME